MSGGGTLVFGATGQVARELALHAPEARCLPRGEADLADPEACAAAIRAVRPTLVLNAAAYTAVDRAEEERGLAFRINAGSPGAMARACAELGVPLVHVSSDYVFDGSGTAPWRPDDPTGPLGVYGASKLAGEDAVRASGARAVTLRTSWVFSAHGSNFLKTMLRLSQTRDRLTIVADQVGGPTPAGAIAEAMLAIGAALKDGAPGDERAGGIVHFSGAPDVSWADFARAIFAAAGRTVAVEDIPTSAYPTPARRPLNSRLDCSATEAAFGLPRPDWKKAAAEIVRALT